MTDEAPKKKNSKDVPAKNYTKEQLEALAENNFARKMEAADKNVIIHPDNQWKTLHEGWNSWNDDHRKDVVFGLAFYSGFKAKDIARLFRVKIEEVSPYKPIIEQGLIALKHKITSNQISFGLVTEQPVVKFHLGKQFAEQVDSPAHEGVDSVVEGPPSIVINEIRAGNEDLRNELEAAVQNAMSKAVRRNVQ